MTLMNMNRFILGSMTAFTLMTFASEADGGRRNPLLLPSYAPFQAIPFDKIATTDYKEAIIEGIRLHNDEIEGIVSSPESPTFQNTIAAFDRSGKILDRAVATLGNLESALGDTALMNIMAEVTPLISEHSTGILLNEGLWKRIKYVYDDKDSKASLSPEALRLLNETYRSFAQSGANLQGEDRERFRRLNAELSDLGVKFSQNVTNGMSDPARRMWIEEADTAGLPELIKKAAREAAAEVLKAEGKPDDGSQYLITVYAPSYVPFMKYADSRDLRERLYKLYNSRYVGGEFDNTQILKDIANIRLEIANLMGKETFAEYQLQGTMAANPKTVADFLEQLRVNYTEPMKMEVKEWKLKQNQWIFSGMLAAPIRMMSQHRFQMLSASLILHMTRNLNSYL